MIVGCYSLHLYCDFHDQQKAQLETLAKKIEQIVNA